MSRIDRDLNQYDAERAQAYPSMPQPHDSPQAHLGHSDSGGSSWDLLGGIKKFENSYAEFDASNAGKTHLTFGEGNIPPNGFARVYNYLLNVSIVTRWTLFIIPVTAILWIPGILGLTSFPDTQIWGVKLIWWSIYLTDFWCGWWGSLAFAMALPGLLRCTLGVVAVGTRRYIEWLGALKRYVAITAWTCQSWIAFQPLINARQDPNTTSSNITEVNTMAKILFALFICAGVLLFEKFAIQWIAGSFHERSYAERIEEQKQAVRILVTLYRHSSNIPGRHDTLRDGNTDKRATMNPRKLFKKAMKGVRFAATTTTTALGNVASEIIGSSVLQPNSPQAMVRTALESANKSRLLARRLFYSFIKPGAEYLVVQDIARFFPTPEDADAAFTFFDKDMNGDASRDEIEMACLECHKEQLSIEHSMRDLDSAVGRLDNILMSLYVVVAILIVAVALEAQLTTLITGAGTLILGLSWLIGGSLSDVLTSIIFLFVKHPYDVGDRVTVDADTYTVKEIRLLSTIFLDGSACVVQAPNTVLNTKFIQNLRRSPQMSEAFEFDVAYSTSFEKIERLREMMIAFLKSERRDYQPTFDVVVVDIPGQEKMTLKADIKYKSNWQQAALRANRRNKWICALKASMAKVRIFGPAGDPDAPPEPARYTLVPWEDVEPAPAPAATKARPPFAHKASGSLMEVQIPVSDWTLTDRDAVLLDDSQDVFDEADELHMQMPLQNIDASPVSTSKRSPLSMPSAVTVPDEIELQTPRGADTFSR